MSFCECLYVLCLSSLPSGLRTGTKPVPANVVFTVVLLFFALSVKKALSVFQFYHHLVGAISIAHVVEMELQVAHVFVYSRGIKDAQGLALAYVETIRQDYDDPREFHLQDSLVNQWVVFYHWSSISIDSV